MSNGLHFDSALAENMQMLYRTEDAARRRRAVVDLLQPMPGERILDIGTGPGFLAMELGSRVQAQGRVLGVDNSEAMLQLARQRCAGQPWVDFQHTDASSLPLPDVTFDAAVSVQVFEYIAEVERAIAEMHRILRPGGRAVVVSTDWDTVLWHAGDPARMERVLRAFLAHCALPALPRTLTPKLRQAGFTVSEQEVIVQFNPQLDPSRFSYYAIAIVERFVAGHDGITQAEAHAWAEDVRQSGEHDDYFFCLNQFVWLAKKH